VLLAPRPHHFGGFRRHGAGFGLRHAHSPWLALLVVLVVVALVVLALRSRR
jgi:lipoprotein signal peptidase